MVAMLPFAATAVAAEPITASNDALRTSWYPDEPSLAPANVASGNFGQVFEVPVQGQVYAQPLVSNGTLLVATEDNWIYGLDSRSGAVKWSHSVGTPFNPTEIPGCTDLMPNVGITGTPVIDPDTGLAYFFAKTYSSPPKSAVWEMHALSMVDGQEAPGFPVKISGEAENISGLQFNAKQELQRPALLLMNGVVYAGFGSHCDNLPYQGWLFGVSTSGQILTRWATGPKGSAIWQSGGGLISDREGSILFATGNSFEPTPPNSPTPPADLGEAVGRVAIGPTGAATATDFFSPFNRKELDENDQDLGSSSPVALPSQYFGTALVPNVLLVGGKEHKIFVLNRDNLGGQGQGAGGKNKVVQEIVNAHSVFGSMAVWPGQGGYVYVPGIGSTGGVEMLQYGTEAGKPHLTLVGQTPDPLRFGSGSPIVTSNGTTPGSAVVWVPQCPTSGCAGSTLNAYPASPSEGAQALFKAPIGISPKFGRPGVAEGRVYVGTRDDRLIAFGATAHTLSVSHEQGGSVSSDLAGIACGASCSHSYADGTKVTLTASPESGFRFSGWSGGGCSGTGSCAVTLFADTSVTAGFARIAAATGAQAPSTPTKPARRPQTKIAGATLRPALGRATFRFRGIGAARFECRLLRAGGARTPAAKRRFGPCRSPRLYRNLVPGSYLFEVRAVNAAGTDPTPAKRRFRL